MEKIEFQERAIEELLETFKTLWKKPQRQLPITLKAPTGSGKTYMTEKFICKLCEQPDWNQDVAFIWITFSDDLAMQSRDKFIDYFGANLPGQLLTKDDFNLGALTSNSVMFLNWQKFVAENADDRVLRRPDDPRNRKEQGYYFEDVLELTQNQGRDIVLIIDESHKNVTDKAYKNVINPANPKIIIKVSATPEQLPSISDIRQGKAGYVEVERKDVIEAGMIKSELVCQTEEDLKKHSGEDLDEVLLQLAIDKREELVQKIQSKKFDVNPLVIIQLPNDDSESIQRGDQTKEEYVTKALLKKGVKEERIAKWFSGQKKPIGLELNDSPYDFLLFKTAAGTGWDCPRAQILVMFREIHSETFETQTLGRIVRIPVRDEKVRDIFTKGYIYTNYKRAEVASANYKEEGNKPNIYTSTNIFSTDYVIDPKLQTEYMPRVDYGDLGKAWSFQKSLFDTFNAYFDLKETDMADALAEKLASKGIDLSTKLTQSIIVNTSFSDYDQIKLELQSVKDTEYEVSQNDVQKLFSSVCVQLLKEQTDDDAKIGNIARSWGSLKSALRFWLKFALPGSSVDAQYRVFLKDINKGASSVFRLCVTKALKDYHPNLEAQLEQRRKDAEAQECSTFTIKEQYSYSEDFDVFDCKKNVLIPFYLRKDYDGRDNETSFIEFIDGLESVEWWMKNGDSGRDYLSFRYFNKESGKKELFYPDWIIKFKDGTVGIFDTKGGNTAVSLETKCKAEELYRKVMYLNGFNRDTIRYIGGIVIKANNQWYVNNSAEYSYRHGSTEGWKPFLDILPK